MEGYFHPAGCLLDALSPVTWSPSLHETESQGGESPQIDSDTLGNSASDGSSLGSLCCLFLDFTVALVQVKHLDKGLAINLVNGIARMALKEVALHKHTSFVHALYPDIPFVLLLQNHQGNLAYLSHLCVHFKVCNSAPGFGSWEHGQRWE